MLDDLEGALAEFDAALALNDAYAEAHLNRGIVLNELGRNHEAVTAFERAGQLDTRDGTIPSDVGNQLAVMHAKLGDLYLVANRPVEAAQQVRGRHQLAPALPRHPHQARGDPDGAGRAGSARAPSSSTSSRRTRA